jgi:acyl carrier protein
VKIGYARERSWIVEATKSVTLHGRRDQELRSRLEDSASDCTFEELHFDSLARMELCIWMQTEAGVELDESEILAHPSVNALAAYLAGKGAASS